MGNCDCAGSRKPPNFSDDDPLDRIQLHGMIDYEETLKRLTFDVKILQNNIHLDTRQPTKVPILVQIQTGLIDTCKTAPIDVILVIDHSSSVTFENLTLMKRSCAKLIQMLGPKDRLSIVGFGFVADRLTPLMKMTDTSKKTVLSLIQRIVPEGGKNITAGIKTAIDIIRKRRYSNVMTSVLLFSDGNDENAGKGLRNLIDSFDAKDIFTINTFAVGQKHNRSLLRSIAHMKGGDFYIVSKQAQGNEVDVVDLCLTTLTKVAAENVVVNVTPLVSESLPNSLIRHAYGFEGCWAHKDSNFQLRIPRLFVGRTENLILELEIPQNKIPRNKLLPPINTVTVDAIWAQICGIGYFGRYKQASEFSLENVLKATVVNPGVEFSAEFDAEVAFQYYKAKGSEIIDLVRSTPNHLFGDWKYSLGSLINEMKASSMMTFEDFKDLIDEFELAFKYSQLRKNKYYSDRPTGSTIRDSVRESLKLSLLDLNI